jgi:hypothetical protein
VSIALPFARVDTALVAAPDPQSVTDLNERLKKARPPHFRGGAKRRHRDPSARKLLRRGVPRGTQAATCTVTVLGEGVFFRLVEADVVRAICDDRELSELFMCI